MSNKGGGRAEGSGMGRRGGGWRDGGVGLDGDEILRRAQPSTCGLAIRSGRDKMGGVAAFAQDAGIRGMGYSRGHPPSRRLRGHGGEGWVPAPAFARGMGPRMREDTEGGMGPRMREDTEGRDGSPHARGHGGEGWVPAFARTRRGGIRLIRFGNRLGLNLCLK